MLPNRKNPGEIYHLLGSYIPFAPTKAARQANRDPRLSTEERYRGLDDYLQRIRSDPPQVQDAVESNPSSPRRSTIAFATSISSNPNTQIPSVSFLVRARRRRAILRQAPGLDA